MQPHDPDSPRGHDVNLEAPTYPDPTSADPRERGLDHAHAIDPGSGHSDDPRVRGTEHRGSTDDDAWQNEFTEETIPSPEQREDAAHETKFDPI